MGEVDFEFREFGDDDSGDLKFAGPAIAAGEFLERAWGQRDDLEPFSPCDGSDFIGEDIQESRTAIIGEEGLFDRQHTRLQIIDEPQYDLSSFSQSLVGTFLFFDYLYAVIDEFAIFQDRHPHVPRPRIDGQNPLIFFEHFIFRRRRNQNGLPRHVNDYQIH